MKKKYWNVSLLILLIVMISGCGCSGQYGIDKLTVEPEVSCLIIWAGNCNEPVLEIENNCSEPVTVGGLKINERRVLESGIITPSYATIDARKGEMIVNHTEGISFYNPYFEEYYTINATIGNKTIKISYVRTDRPVTGRQILGSLIYLLIFYIIPCFVVIYVIWYIVYKRKNKIKKK